MMIEIYGQPNCVYCQKALDLCKANRFEYIYRDITLNKSIRQEFDERSRGAKTVPQVFVGTTHVGGFDDLQETVRSGVIYQLIGGS